MKNEVFLEENYIKEYVTINLIWVSIFAVIVLVIVLLFFGLAFYLLWLEKFENIAKILELSPIRNLNENSLLNKGIIIFILLSLVVIHEFIHGIFFSMFTKNKLKSVKFGFMPARKLFTPYCHCKEKLKIYNYQIALIMPLVIIGFIPTIISIIIGNNIIFCWGILSIAGCGGDILILLKTLKEKRECWIFDHPTEAGYYLYRKVN